MRTRHDSHLDPRRGKGQLTEGDALLPYAASGQQATAPRKSSVAKKRNRDFFAIESGIDAGLAFIKCIQEGQMSFVVKGSIMPFRTPCLLIVAAMLGAISLVATATDAFAKKGKSAPSAQAAAAGPVVVPDSNIPADRVPRCFDSLIRYPSPPCY